MNKKLQHIIHGLAVSLPAMLLAMNISSCSSCSSDKDAGNPEDSVKTEREQFIQASQEKSVVQKMGSYDVTESTSQGGHSYQYRIAREASDSLGIVVDSEGYRWADNAITLSVSCDGAPIFSRRFTRQAFKIGISDAMFSHYVLENIVFDKITPSGPRFVVSVGEAETDDMCVLFDMTIGMDGSVNITRREVFDEEEITRVESDEEV